MLFSLTVKCQGQGILTDEHRLEIVTRTAYLVDCRVSTSATRLIFRPWFSGVTNVPGCNSYTVHTVIAHVNTDDRTTACDSRSAIEANCLQ